MPATLAFRRLPILALFLALVPTVLATAWYVDGVNGSDNNNCRSRRHACKTISNAISATLPGDSIFVAPTVYHEAIFIPYNLNIIGSGAKTTIIDAGGLQSQAAVVGSEPRIPIASPTRDLQFPPTQASADDTFIEIDHPEGVRGTRAWSLDTQDDVIGSYEDARAVRHGFFWHDGQFTTIDDPKAGHGPPRQDVPQGTTLYDINRFGDITGRYYNSNHESHSFVLRAGRFTPIDDPNSPHARFHGTQADSINDAGDIVGDFNDEDFTVHGFVLHDGTYTTIDAPHAEHGRGEGTHAFGINNAGDIVLFTQAGLGDNFEGYLLHDGRFKKIADPRAVGGTIVEGINAAGVIVGEYLDGNGVSHGMVYCNGIFTTHDDPNAAGGLGTGLKKINLNGDIAGWYTDRHNHDHGFLLRLGHDPCPE